jgi:quercetin dioxygenase-like cupin family protein
LKDAYFYTAGDCPKHEIFPGVTIQTSWLDRVMTSLVTFQPDSIVLDHSHPHEQMGIIISGKVSFTIGGQTQELGPGDMYRIPSNIVHRVAAVAGPAVAFDVFSPARDDYK